MRAKILFYLSPVILLGACDNNHPKTSAETAKDRNEQTIENKDLQDDAAFLVKVAEEGIWEVELGKVASKKATTEEVKRFANMMVDQHTRVNGELKTLAVNKNITIPTSLSEDKQKELEKLSAKTGRDFDDAYIDEMKDDHEKDVKAFEKKVDDDKADADIKHWASDVLPILKNHLAEIKGVEERFDAAKK